MKKFEFSKKLVVWAIMMATACVIASYALAFLGREVAQDVTITVVTACTGIAAGYLAKSYGEKASRNKYGLDENGVPYGFDDDIEITTDIDTEVEVDDIGYSDLCSTERQDPGD